MSYSKIKVSNRIKVFAAVFIVAAIFLQFWRYHWSTTEIGLKGQTLNVLVAKTLYQHKKGLGGRDSIAPYDGMLFLFPFSRKEGFVMRDKKFPIDIIWFDNGRVVDIAPNLPLDSAPEEQLRRYYPRVNANVVLELPAGWATARGLKIGDVLTVRP
ncbi:MAG: DUF192 domain-containing protein [Patescibacteria group bacterium]